MSPIRLVLSGSLAPLGVSVVGFAVALLLVVLAPVVLPDLDRTPDWTSPLVEVDRFLAAGDIPSAVLHSHHARTEALAARRWEGLIEVGDAYRRIAVAGGFVPEADATARQLYLAALSRARGEGSLDGALRAAEGLAALGERDVVVVALAVARTLAGEDVRAQARVQVLARKWQEQQRGASPRPGTTR